MSRRSCSCGVEVAPLLAEPRDGAEQATQALRGELLEVEEERDGWAHARTAYDYAGWIRAEHLSDAASNGWPPEPRAGDPVEEARAYLGARYLWGGMTEGGIDCSGLVHMAYRRLGRLVPRDAHEQEAAGARLAEHELRRGDLVTYGAETTTHIAFWLGDGRILHAAGGKGCVEEPEPEKLRRKRRTFVRL